MHRVFLTLGALLLLTSFAVAKEAPWHDQVEPADRPLLDRLLSADETVREAAAREWEEARLAALPEYGPNHWPPSPVAALSDEVDPLDPWAVRKKRMMTALVTALQTGAETQRVAAARSIRDLAPAYTSVIDVLAATLTDAPAPVRLEVMRTLGGITHLSGGRYVDTKLGEVVACIEDVDAAVRAAALRLVGLRIPYGHANDGLRRHAQALALKASGDPDAAVRMAALHAAGSLSPPKDGKLLAALVAGLDDESPQVRGAAAAGIAARPEGAEPALGRLRALLQDDDFDVRYGAASAIWSVRRKATGLLPVLIEALDRFEGIELASVARLLTVIGPPAAAATPGLVHALGRIEPMRHFTTGREIHEALVSIGPSADLALPVIEAELQRRSAADRPVVLGAIVTVYGDTERLGAFVVEMLSQYACPDPSSVEATVLRRLGIETPALLDRYRGLLDSDDQQAARRAEYELGRLGTPGAVKLLVDRMGDPMTCPGAIIALMDAHENARAAIPALVRALPAHSSLAATALARTGGGDDPEVVAALLAALEKAPADELGIAVALCDAVCLFGGSLEPCLDPLLAALDDRNAMVQRQGAEALGRWGPQAEKALPRLRELMAQGDPFYEGLAAATAVWQISGKHAPTYEYALRAAKNSHPPSWMAVHTLRLLGPRAAEAVPVLVDAALGWRRAFHRQEDVMREATLALGAIGPAAAEALPVLRELEHNHLVRDEARRAIEQIEDR